jgi:glutathione S-transferase
MSIELRRGSTRAELARAPHDPTTSSMKREEHVLELYHSINSVCAQKVRIALAEKQVEYREHLMTLRGDQFDPAYMKLNPNAVVPTLVHDGCPIVESSIILYYIDEAFPEPPLMPKAPLARAQARMYNKLIDEYVHNSCTTITFATAFRANLARLSKDQLEAQLAKSPSQKRSELKRDVVAHGLDSKFVTEALHHHEKLLGWMEGSLRSGAYLAGDTYSLADIAVIPYILRLDLLRLSRLWERRAGVAQWYARMRERPAFKKAILERMSEADAAPFETFQPDPWPKVEALLRAA